MAGFRRQAVVAWLLAWGMSVAGSAAPAEVHLVSGERLRVTALVYDGQVLVAESAYGRLSFPKDRLRYVVWGEAPADVTQLAGYVVLSDGTRLRAAAERIGPDGMIARTPWGVVAVTEVGPLVTVPTSPPVR